MKTAKELLLTYLADINDADKVIELFADDATIELPYLESLGGQFSWTGKEVLYKFIKNLQTSFPGFHFKDIEIHIDTPQQAFGEYKAEATFGATGKPYHQMYMGRLVAENGKIKLLREALNMVPVVENRYPEFAAILQ